MPVNGPAIDHAVAGDAYLLILEIFSSSGGYEAVSSALGVSRDKVLGLPRRMDSYDALSAALALLSKEPVMGFVVGMVSERSRVSRAVARQGVEMACRAYSEALSGMVN